MSINYCVCKRPHRLSLPASFPHGYDINPSFAIPKAFYGIGNGRKLKEVSLFMAKKDDDICWGVEQRSTLH
jgi:hypothetical protein